MDNLHPNVLICMARNNGRYVRRSVVVMTIASQCADLGKPNKQYSFSLPETLMDHYEWVQLRSASTLLKIFFSSRVCPVITMGALCESAVCTCVVCVCLCRLCLLICIVKCSGSTVLFLLPPPRESHSFQAAHTHKIRTHRCPLSDQVSTFWPHEVHCCTLSSRRLIE